MFYQASIGKLKYIQLMDEIYIMNVIRLCAIAFPLKYHIHATSNKGKIVCAITIALTIASTITGEF